ncbi:MAG TPA: DUF72 domain-containing protein [Alphaproteobacteria bacterium]|nr:DUF72 domain-containing protein [Alphaproteobacteria bacterium]
MAEAMTGRGHIRIGTSGWHYVHWRGPFYPQDVRSADYLAFYAGRFDTAEINNSFYRLPSAETVAHWAETVPAGFRFACKASRFITHMKKLKDPTETTRAFFEVMGGLGRRMGPVLFQLPPHWRADPGRLDAFLAALPPGGRYAVECRDESWLAAPVYRVLERHGAALCLYEIAGRRSRPRLTADFTYVRLHGPGEEAYRGSYDGRTLNGWARRLGNWAAEGVDAWCYFDNDEAGYAPNDARRLKAML